MEKEAEKVPSSSHVLLLPYPSQGHINPMLKFGKCLVARGLQVTIATTRFIARSSTLQSETRNSVRVAQISDGYDGGGFEAAESIQAYLEGFKAAGSKTLADLIREERAQRRPVRCVVYDAFLPWALDVAKGMGLLAAAFFSQSCAVNAIYYHVYHGRLPVPSTPSLAVSLEGLRQLSVAEAPSFLSRPGEYAAYFALVVNQFSNLEKADAVFVNTFYQLEPQEADWMATLFPTKTIGPTIPSLYLGLPEEEDRHYGFDLYTAENHTSCINWLDTHEEPGSVVYVSFGSMANLSAEQMEELAWGMMETGKQFLWVVRASEEGKLPAGFTAAVVGKGLVTRWSPQLEVLAHPAVGCFVTHCGWNSTLEALSLGVPMVGMPQWTDQPTNAKYVEDVWGTGVRVNVDGRGVVRREELESRIREVMEGKRGEEIRMNAQKWRKLAAEAVGDGGSSDRNMWEFVRAIVGEPVD